MFEKLHLVHSVGLAENICAGNALSWSKENKISLCTETGIYIMELKSQCKLSNRSLQLHKSHIPVASSYFSFNLDSKRDFLHVNLEKEKLFHLILNRTLSPANVSNQAFRGYRCAKWSPVGMDKDGRCFLITLTMDFRLVLYETSDMPHKVIKILSSSLVDYLQQISEILPDIEKLPEENDESHASALLDQLQAQTYKLASVDVVWSNLFTSSDESQSQILLLITAQKSGHIVVWRFKIPLLSSDDCLVSCFFHSTLELPKVVAWYQQNDKSGFLAIGNIHGEVKILSLLLNKENEFIPGSIQSVWSDQDSLAVTHLEFIINCHQSSDKIEKSQEIGLVIAKENFFITCRIDITENNIGISHVIPLRGPHSLPLAGLTAAQNYLFGISFDGSLLQINSLFQEQGVVLDIQPSLLEERERPYITGNGIAVSPNGTFIAFAESIIKRQFDPHINSEPLKVHWMIIKNTNQVIDELLNHTGLVRDCFDDLECLRLLLVMEESNSEKITEICQLVETHLFEQATQKLKIIRILFLMLLSENQQEETFKRHLQTVENLIMERHMLNYIQTHSNKLQEHPPDGATLTSLNRMCQWLQNHSSSSNVQEVTTGVQEKLKCLELPAESCIICQEPEICESYHTVQCKNEHSFFLCCHSMLTCNKTNNQRCYLCQTLAVSSSDITIIFLSFTLYIWTL